MEYVVVVFVVPMPLVFSFPRLLYSINNHVVMQCYRPCLLYPFLLRRGFEGRPLMTNFDVQSRGLTSVFSSNGDRSDDFDFSCEIPGSVPFDGEAKRNCGAIGEKWNCKSCGRYFPTIRSFSHHMLDKHCNVAIGKRVFYLCPLCQDFTGLKSQFYDHFLFCNVEE